MNPGIIPAMNAKDKKRQSTIYFSEKTLKRLKVYGIVVDEDLSDIVERFCNEGLDRAGAPPAPELIPLKK